jgi:hypothetical protein
LLGDNNLLAGRRLIGGSDDILAHLPVRGWGGIVAQIYPGVNNGAKSSQPSMMPEPQIPAAWISEAGSSSPSVLANHPKRGISVSVTRTFRWFRRGPHPAIRRLKGRAVGRKPTRDAPYCHKISALRDVYDQHNVFATWGDRR